jgi:Ca-activated chloride channel family protein
MSESRVETEGVDIVLVVDTSTSMRADDFSTATKRMDRLDAAKSVLAQFIQARPDDRLGIVAFAAMPYTIAPLTTDHAWLMLQLDRLQTGMLEDATAIGDALASGVNRLRDSKAKSKIVILLTDGIHNAGRLTPPDAAQAAAALGIKVYTVGAGSDQPRATGTSGSCRAAT